jgi:hypothetical protein
VRSRWVLIGVPTFYKRFVITGVVAMVSHVSARVMKVSPSLDVGGACANDRVDEVR